MLYRHVAEQADVHATTVHRYHSGYLATAPAAVLTCTRDLLRQVRKGRSLAFERGRRRPRAVRGAKPAARVPASEVRRRIDEISQALDLCEHQILFRYLAERIGVHATTVLRYHMGELKTAPASLLVEIERLRRRVVTGEIVMFSRSPEGAEVVQRERTRAVIAKLLERRGELTESAFLGRLDRKLGLPPGLARRIWSEPDLCLVRAGVHRALEGLADGAEYDPVRTYAEGEPIRHHLFGRGVVLEKVHKNKILVGFEDDRRVLLAEAVPEDPFLGRRLVGGGEVYPSSRAAVGSGG